MRHSIFSIMPICALLLFGCVQNQTVNSSDCQSGKVFRKIVVQPSDEADTCYNVDNLFDSVTFVKLSNEPEALVSSIQQILVRDSLIVILDRYGSGVKLFSMTGHFLGSVGHFGRGPGEYVEPTHIDISDQSILVWDQFSQKINYYGLDGIFQSSKEFKMFALKCHQFAPNRILFNSVDSDNGREIRDYSIFLCDSLSKISERSLFRKKGTYSSLWLDHNFHSTDSVVYFKPVYSDTIYSIASDCTCSPEYIIEFGTRTVPEKLRKPLHKRMAKKEYEQDNFSFFDGEFFVLKDYLLFEYTKARHVYHGLYSVEKDTLICFSNWSIEKGFPAEFRKFMTTTDNAFVNYFFPASPLGTFEILDKDKEGYMRYYGKERTDLIYSMKNDDNAIITFFYPSL